MAKGSLVEEIDEKEFDLTLKSKVVIVDFFAEWCMPCLMMAPVFEEIADRMKSVKFAKVNVDENQELAGKFKVMSIPCLIIFKNGKEVERIIGSQTSEAIEEKLKKYI